MDNKLYSMSSWIVEKKLDKIAAKARWKSKTQLENFNEMTENRKLQHKTHTHSYLVANLWMWCVDDNTTTIEWNVRTMVEMNVRNNLICEREVKLVIHWIESTRLARLILSLCFWSVGIWRKEFHLTNPSHKLSAHTKKAHMFWWECERKKKAHNPLSIDGEKSAKL